jgi:hypothetical protein
MYQSKEGVELKRFLVAATVMVAMLVGATSAFAAINNYNATYKFMGKAGTASKPAPLSFQQNISVTAATNGSRAGLLHTIQTTITGVKVNVKGFPTCTAKQIASASNFDKSCNSKALVATGGIKALLGPSDFTQQGQTCNPHLHVWNSGKGKLTFFFVSDPSGAHTCLGGQIHTGQVAPFPATYKQVGKNISITIPIPNFVDQPVPSLFGSLVQENLLWKSQTVKGVTDIASTGCSGSKRKYTWAFNASLPGQAPETKKYSGSASCG